MRVSNRNFNSGLDEIGRNSVIFNKQAKRQGRVLTLLAFITSG